MTEITCDLCGTEIYEPEDGRLEHGLYGHPDCLETYEEIKALSKPKERQYTYQCDGCGTRLSPKVPGWYREVKGWEQIRKGGGANAIRDRVETGAMVCAGCYAALKPKSPQPRGETLFDW